MIETNMTGQSGAEQRVEAFSETAQQVQQRKGDFAKFQEKMESLAQAKLTEANKVLEDAGTDINVDTIRQVDKMTGFASKAANVASESHKVNTFLCAMIKDSRF